MLGPITVENKEALNNTITAVTLKLCFFMKVYLCFDTLFLTPIQDTSILSSLGFRNGYFYLCLDMPNDANKDVNQEIKEQNGKQCRSS